MRVLTRFLLLSVAIAGGVDAEDPASATGSEMEIKPAKAKISEEKKKAQLKMVTKSLKMIVELHDTMGPLLQTLETTLGRLPEGPDREHIEKMHTHVLALDQYSIHVSQLVQGLEEAGESKGDKKAAMHELVVAMPDIARGVKEHLKALRLLKAPADAADEKDDGIAGLKVMLAEMEAHVRRDMADPATKDSPELKRDVVQYALVQQAVEDAESLYAVATSYLDKNPSPEMEIAILAVLKPRFEKIMTSLQTGMQLVQTVMDKGQIPHFDSNGGTSHLAEEMNEQQAADGRAFPKRYHGEGAAEITEAHERADIATEDVPAETSAARPLTPPADEEVEQLTAQINELAQPVQAAAREKHLKTDEAASL